MEYLPERLLPDCMTERCRSTLGRHNGRRCMLLAPLLAGCDGLQSALNPAGKEAQEIATLFAVLLGGAIVIWLLMNGLFLYVTRLNPTAMPRRTAEMIIIGGGIIFPVIVLSALLIYSLTLVSVQRMPGEDLEIRVTGEQWWWRIEYLDEQQNVIAVSANEIRLPVDKRAEITLGADEVIHSFWIPSLAGKVDMFPGRTTRLALEPTELGTFRGQCAEFCGASHALMAFQAVVVSESAFDLWLEAQAKPASTPEDTVSQAGLAVFLSEGCGACHAIRGTAASSSVGPDLTHVGSRTTLGAGMLSMDREDIARWLKHTTSLKPEVAMPDYSHLSASDINALSIYLAGLQ